MDQLLPAIKQRGRIFVGKPDDSHVTLQERSGLTPDKNGGLGFVPSVNQRMWLSRKQAVQWLSQREPDIYTKIQGKVPPEGLHSHIYAAARGIVQRLTKAERSAPPPVKEVPQDDPQPGKAAQVVDLSDKTLVMVDHGISIHLAEKLAESYGKVILYIPNVEAYPCPDRDVIGTGLKDVERVYDLVPVLEEHSGCKPDVVFFFPDIGFAGEQRRLKADGWAVCGSGDSDRLELDKWFFQQQLEKVGLPTAHTEKLKGITALCDYLKGRKEGGCFIKVSHHRGLMETKRWLGKFLSSVWLKDLETRLGHHAESQVFLVQDKIDSVGEIGVDTFNLNGQIPENSLCGLEAKDAGYFCKVFKEQPEILKAVNDAMAPVFEKLGMNGQYSTEVRIDEKQRGYYIDGTMRMPSPPGELMPEMYKEHCYARAIWSLAHGELPVLEPAYQYGAEVILTSSWLEDGHWLPIEFPPEALRFVRLKNYCIIGGKYYIVPNNNGSFLGGAIGMGNTPEEACKMALKYAESVHGEDVKYESDVLERAQKGIEKMKSVGIEF